MFVDASAILTILNEETGCEEFVKRIEEGDAVRFVSPLVRFEAVTGLARSRSGEASFKTRNRIPCDEFEYFSKF